MARAHGLFKGTDIMYSHENPLGMFFGAPMWGFNKSNWIA
jgi:hypothetical protein